MVMLDMSSWKFGLAEADRCLKSLIKINEVLVAYKGAPKPHFPYNEINPAELRSGEELLILTR